MPPKKASAKSKSTKKHPSSEASKQEEAPPTVTERPVTHDESKAAKRKPPENSSSAMQSNMAKKRKSPASEEHTSTQRSKPVTKTPRQGTRTSTRANKPSNSSSSSSASPTPQQLIAHLLSPSSLPHACPEDELFFARSHPSTKTYSLTAPHVFTPFQHLLSASLLSKPLSHVLGLRSIRTLLNGPFSLTSPAAIASAGEHRVWEALEAARTQHRQKTAAYIHQMAKTCQEAEGKSDGLGGEQFEGLKLKTKTATTMDAVDTVMAEIKGKVKGMGVIGAEVFVRRVQCCDGWKGLWPFADGKALGAVKEIGLGDVKDAAQLRSWVEEVVERMGRELGDMGFEGLEKGTSQEQMLRVAFVVVLERALGAVLEGKANELRTAAAAEAP